MHILKRSLLLLGVTALTLTACKDDAVAPDTIAVTNITVSPPSLVMNAGTSSQVSATVSTNGGTGTINLGVTWTSSNTNVVSVTNAGAVTACAACSGTATLTATSIANTAYSASVAVSVNFTQVNALLTFDVTPSSQAVALGGSVPLVTTTTTSAGATAVTFANSSNSARCTLSSATGANPTVNTVAAQGVGSCVITIIASSSGTGLVSNQITRTVAITVTASTPAVLSLTLSPTSVNMVPGQSQTISTTAVTSAGAGAVTYTCSTSNVAVAITTSPGSCPTGGNPVINATGNGIATITVNATATLNGVSNTVSATVQVNVQAASVSISSLVSCPGGVPPCGTVNLANVFGQVEAIVNINTGFQALDRVVIFVGPTISPTSGTCPAATAATYVEAVRETFGVNGAPTAPITLSIKTAEFDANFNPKFLNGFSCVVARVFPKDITQPQPDASPSHSFTLTNPDVVYFNASVGTTSGAFGLNHTGISAAQVSVPANIWWKSGFTFRAHPVLYSGASNVVSITYTSSACGAQAAVGPNFVATYTCAAVQSTQSMNNTVTIAYVPTYTLTVSPTTFMTAASAGFIPGNPVYSVVTTREDNVAPVIVVGNVAFNDAFDQMWVNGSYAFAGDFTITDAGVGVNTAASAVRVFGTAGVIPAHTAGCSSSNPTVVTGADLVETLTSDGSPEGYRVCAIAADVLANANAGSGGSNFFGVDKVAPSSRLAGAAPAPLPLIAPSTLASVSSTPNTTIYGDLTPRPLMPATDVWGLEGIDTRSGFNQNAVAGFPAVQTLARLAPLAPTSCASFTNPMNVVLADNWVRVAVLVALDCGNGLGYYTYNGVVVDRAGNGSTAIVRNFARDHVAAPVLSSIGLASVFYTSGAAAGFTLFGSDDLEIIEGDVSVSYPNDGTVTATIEGITYALATIGGAARWDALLNTTVLGQTISVSSLLGRIDFTCTAAAAPYASCAAADGIATVAAEFNNVVGATNDLQNPDSVRAVAYDVASNVSNSVATSILTAQTTDVAQQWVGADLLRWRINSVGASVVAEHMASTSITAPYFDSVLLARADAGATEIRVCGTFTAPTLSDNGVNRFWTYSLTTPSGTATCATGGLWYAIGIKNGAALISRAF